MPAISSRWVLLLAFLTAVGASFAVASFHRVADSRRGNQLRLAHIEQHSKELRLSEMAPGSRPGGEAVERQNRSELKEALADLASADPDSDGAANVAEAATSYLENAEQHLRLRRQLDTEAAHHWEEQRSGPSYYLLIEAIYQASSFYSGQAGVALRRANAGSTLAIVLQALLTWLLAYAAERNRRSHELRMAEERARKDAQFRSMIQNSSDVIAILTATGQVKYLSPSVRRVLGFEPEEWLGKSGFQNVHPDDLSKAEEHLGRVLDKGGSKLPTQFEIRLLHADGSWRWTEVSASNLLSDTTVGGIVLNFRDVTERKMLEDQLRHQALHDPLTGLANRALFNNLLGHALPAARRRQTRVGVFFLDLDNFKQINDGLGHEAGDQLLRQVAGRLRSNVRGEDTPARLGGDEFAVLAAGIDERGAAELAARLLADLRRPFELAGQEVTVGASIGIAFSTAEETSSENMLRNADVAMYVAKTGGKGRFAIFESGMYQRVKQDLEIELDLRFALENEQLELHYQPILELETGHLMGVEALVRWRDRAKRRLRMPGEFLPIAEQTGLIIPLGHWVVRNACRQVREWQLRYPDTPPMALSVNLSKRQFQDPGLVEMIEGALAESGLPGQHLILEVAEEVLLDQPEPSEEKLRGLKRLGVRLAIDNFGGGYSSLRQLRRFPVDVVKIHKSFVEGLTVSPGDAELTHSLIDLARRLKFQTIAEGIEVDRQAAVLGQMGCELGQGFHLARPLDAIGFESMLGVIGCGDWRADTIELSRGAAA